MNVNLSTQRAVDVARSSIPTPRPPKPDAENNPELQKAFQAFVGQTLFGQMLGAMRKTLGKPAYFHGGRAEEIFQQQLDQVLAEKLSDASGKRLAEPMFELFSLERR